MLCIEANCATICLKCNKNAPGFLQLLDPLYVPLHQVAFMCIVRLLEQAVTREYHCIVNDTVLLYGTDFVSTNLDFDTNKECHKSFGCLVANMLAWQYVLDVSLWFVFCLCCSLFSRLPLRSFHCCCCFVSYLLVYYIGWMTTLP
jgi:hypothetical protein